MKANEVQVGGCYEARVSGNLTVVRLDQISTGRGARGDQTYYEVTNLKSGRRATFRTAAKFHKEVDPAEYGVSDLRAPKVEDEQSFPPPSTTPALSAVATAVEANASPMKTTTAQITSSPTPSSHVTTNGSGLGALLRREMRSHSDPDIAPHLIIEARAGTGKTTTLVEGLKYLFGGQPSIKPSPQQEAIWNELLKSKGKIRSSCFLAFNSSIAQELQRRVPKECPARTLHSTGFYAVRKAFNLLGGEQATNANRVTNIIAELMRRDLRTLRKDKAVLLKATTQLVAMCKMQLIGTEQLPGESEDVWISSITTVLEGLAWHYGIELPARGTDDRRSVMYLVPDVLERCKDVGRDRCIDFNDMIWLPVVLDLPVYVNDLLLIDEAQDLNKCQQALAKKIGRRIILCGDPKQAIYQFSGSDSASMRNMFEELKATDRGCEWLPLTVTRRCGKKIVEEAKHWVPDFEAHESNPDGEVTEAKYPTQVKGKETYELKYEETYMASVQDGDMILCRTNAPLVNQCLKFLKRGRKAFIQGRDVAKGLIALVEQFNASSIPQLVQYLSDWHQIETAKETAEANPSEAKLQRINDQYECLRCFVDVSQTVPEVSQRIQAIFTDDEKSPGIKLSSIHKAKGLESHRVYFLKPNAVPMRSRDKMKSWEIEGEDNLDYVGVTRAINKLCYVY